MFEQTKEFCNMFLELGVPGFDLMVYKDGQCILRHMGGYADLENKIPIQGKEKYHIYSCSKLFTCVAALQLWEKGLFRLEDKLSDYLPAFRDMKVKTENGVVKAKNPIRIRHLFEMGAGFNYNLRTPELLAYYEASGYRCPTVELVNELAKAPLEFEPGEGWLYSLCHDVLAALVEVVSGQKFESYVKEHIFGPLGMSNSDFLHPMEDWEGFARLYCYNEQTGERMPRWINSYRPGSEYASGGAGCVSTVEDYIKFLEAVRVGDGLLKKQTVDMMGTGRLTGKAKEMYGSSYYGLGVRAVKPGRPEFGWGGAAGAFASVDVQNNVTIYYAQHLLMAPNRPLRINIYDAVMADLLGEKVHIPQSPSAFRVKLHRKIFPFFDYFFHSSHHPTPYKSYLLYILQL